MSITTLAALRITDPLKRITHYTLGWLIVLYGCGSDSEDTLDHIGITARDNGNRPVIELSGVLELTALKSTNTYKLSGGAVTVPSGSVLTVEPGTMIIGSGSPRSWLVVEIGAKLIAEGTPKAPIVFTSGKPEGTHSARDWAAIS